MKNYLKPLGQSVWVTLQYSDVSSDNSHIWPLKYLGVQTAQRCKTSTKKKILKKLLSPGFEVVFHCGFMSGFQKCDSLGAESGAPNWRISETLL